MLPALPLLPVLLLPYLARHPRAVLFRLAHQLLPNLPILLPALLPLLPLCGAQQQQLLRLLLLIAIRVSPGTCWAPELQHVLLLIPDSPDSMAPLEFLGPVFAIIIIKFVTIPQLQQRMLHVDTMALFLACCFVSQMQLQYDITYTLPAAVAAAAAAAAAASASATSRSSVLGWW